MTLTNKSTITQHIAIYNDDLEERKSLSLVPNVETELPAGYKPLETEYWNRVKNFFVIKEMEKKNKKSISGYKKSKVDKEIPI